MHGYNFTPPPSNDGSEYTLPVRLSLRLHRRTRERPIRDHHNSPSFAEYPNAVKVGADCSAGRLLEITRLGSEISGHQKWPSG